MNVRIHQTAEFVPLKMDEVKENNKILINIIDLSCSISYVTQRELKKLHAAEANDSHL